MQKLSFKKLGIISLLWNISLLALTNVAQGRLNFGLGSRLSFPIPSELACENYPIVMRCPGTDVIEVVSAEYGRQNTETCATTPERMKNTACYLPEAFNIMAAKCNNQTQCRVVVSDEIFQPDPCPGTHKYLQVTFRCVKYLFGCPGTLTGIGSNDTAVASMEPQAGSWIRDPILKPERIFYVPASQQSVQEYGSKDEFLRGDNPLQMYTLPSSIAGTSLVVYDGNIFYVKEHRRIVKYSMRAQMRLRESSLPTYSTHHAVERGSVNGVDLAVDENGLWVIYTTARDAGRIVISKVNKDTLQLETTYKTTYPKQKALHTFVVCGVLYVVGHRSGIVDYMYNTNVDSKNGRPVSIGFDRIRPLSPFDPAGLKMRTNLPATRRLFSSPSGLSAKTRSFAIYNFSSLKYNPRDRLLYAWDASKSLAVCYKLHYGLPQPADANLPSTTSSTTTTTSTTTTRGHRPSTSISTTTAPDNKSTRISTTPSTQTKIQCQATSKDGIFWPATDESTTRRMPCPDVSGAEAVWRCELDQFTSEARWADRPDLSACGSWITDLENQLNKSHIDPSVAVEKLALDLVGVSGNDEPLSSKELSSASRVIRTASQMAGSDVNQLTIPQVRSLTKGVTDSVNALISGKNRQSWKSLARAQRHGSCNDILRSVESTGFIFADSVATNMPSLAPSTSVTRKLEKKDVFVQINVQKSTHAQSLTFPNAVAVNDFSQWSLVTDRVLLSADLIASLANGQGSSKVVFSLINNLGEYVNAPLHGGTDENTEDWSVDSRVISVSVENSNRRVYLKSPVKITMENVNQNRQNVDVLRKCVYWSYSESDKKGAWRTDGCQVTAFNVSHTECSCTHLTSFAILVNVRGIKAPSTEQQLALEIITYVGICISLLCLAICICTFTFFRRLQDDRNTIHKHLCLSLFVAELVFLVGIWQTTYPIPCAVIAGVLHYSFLSAFMWMALEGFQLYVMLVEVFKGRSRWKWYYLIGYGVPAAIVGVSAVVDSSGYGTEEACWLRVDSGFIWSFVGPVCIVILCNLVFLAITVFKMYRHTRAYTDSSKLNAIKASVRGASVLLCLLGITWAFGILWVWERVPIMAYLFCIFNAFQGVGIFFFHCVLQKKIWAEYSRCCSRMTWCRKRGQDSYVSNSMSFSKQYTPGRYSAPNTTHNSTLATQTASSQLRRMWNETVVVNGPRTSESVAVNHSQDLSVVPSRDLLRVNRNQRHSAAQQFPSSSSPQLRRASAERFLDVGQHAPPAPGDHHEGSSHEDEVFLPSKNFGFAQSEAVAEDAYEYDRLQRHCHTNENCGRQSHPYAHSTESEFSHQHHVGLTSCGQMVGHPSNGPRPQPRSMTMGAMKPLQDKEGFVGSGSNDRLNRQQLQRATTLAQQPDKLRGVRRPSSPTRRYSQPTHLDGICPHHAQEQRCQNSCFRLVDHPHANQFRPYCNSDAFPSAAKQHPALDSVHPLHTHRRRRSLTSSDSDDPVVNDFSASSSAGSSCGNPASLSRVGLCRTTLPENVIQEHRASRSDCDNKRDQQVYADEHREAWTPLYRDENDLEVQMLTGPNEPSSSRECMHNKLSAVDSQRDSAFYQSMHDLNGSPAVNYSSPSSGCSPEMGDDDMAYRERPRADPDSVRYVMSHPKSLKSARKTVPVQKERVYEDMIIKSHENVSAEAAGNNYCSPRSSFHGRAEPHGERYTEHVPNAPEYNSSLMNPSKHQIDDGLETGRNSASSARRMTCL